VKIRTSGAWLTLYAYAVCINPAASYELGTHGRITGQSYDRSVLATDGEIIHQLALDRFVGLKPFGDKYFDLSVGNIRERNASSFSTDENKLPNQKTDAHSIKGWLMRGAIREDDIALPFTSPQDDPYGDIFRVFNHFYDPVNDRALTVPLFGTLGEKAPNWALGTNDFLAELQATNATRRNHFTVHDAREAMFRALTGRDAATGNRAIVPDGNGSARGPLDDVEAEQVRKTYWATTFRALGDVLHLVEDRAQPQHVNNDHSFNSSLDRRTCAPIRQSKSDGPLQGTPHALSL